MKCGLCDGIAIEVPGVIEMHDAGEGYRPAGSTIAARIFEHGRTAFELPHWCRTERAVAAQLAPDPAACLISS